MAKKKVETMERDVNTPENGSLDVADIAPVSRPKGVKLDEIVALKRRGFTDAEAGKQLGVSRQAVSAMLKRSGVDLADVEVFKEAEPDILASKRKLLLDSITEKDIAATKSVRDRMVSYGIAVDKSRLLSGESTSNIGIIAKWTDVVHRSAKQLEADSANNIGINDPEYLTRCRKTAQEVGRLDEQLAWERDERARLKLSDKEVCG